MLNVHSSPDAIHPVFRLAFRPFFLMGAIFSIVALVLWSLVLTGKLIFTPFGGALWWHMHEMLFGFAAAIVVGFLLTAVQNWSGIPGVSGNKLIFLFSLWLIPRVLMLGIVKAPTIWFSILDCLFLPVAAYFLAQPILIRKLYRNLIFIPVLLVMASMNGWMHWGVTTNNMAILQPASYAMVCLVALLMTVLGGRVIPMFTANGTMTPKVNPIKFLEIAVIFSTVLVALTFILPIDFSFAFKAFILVFSAIAHIVRVLRWRFWVTFKVPLVWSLHISYFCIPLGFFLLSGHYLGLAMSDTPNFLQTISASSAMHVITVGGIGTMILAMISRVSLGHTGRPILVGNTMAVAFGFLVLAFITRSLLPMVFDDLVHLYLVATVFWALGYGIFVFKYFNVLTKPRIDGRPG